MDEKRPVATLIKADTRSLPHPTRGTTRKDQQRRSMPQQIARFPSFSGILAAAILMTGFARASDFSSGLLDDITSKTTIIFHPATTSGETTEFRVLSLTRYSGEQYAQACSKATCSGLAWGEYEATIQLQPSNRIVKRSFLARGGTERITIGIGDSVGGIVELEARDFRGRILNLPKTDKARWVRFAHVVGNGSREVPIDRDGRFTVHSLGPGQWFLTVLEGPNVVMSRQLGTRWPLEKETVFTYSKEDAALMGAGGGSSGQSAHE